MPTTFDRMLHAESRGRQHDSNGRVIRSPVGAVGIAQVMPSTGPEAARLAGVPWDPVRFERDADYNRSLGQAYHNEMGRQFGGNERQQVAAYNAGPGRVRAAIRRRGADWEADLPAETRNYLNNVLDGGGAQPQGSSPARITPVPVVRIPTADELLHGNPLAGIGATEDALRQANAARPVAPKVNDLVRAALTGGDGMITTGPMDTTAPTTEIETGAAATAEEEERNNVTHAQRFEAVMDETLLGQLLTVFDDQTAEFDPEFMRTYADNWQQIESFAQSDNEVAMIREATSSSHLQTITADINTLRERERVINTSDSPTLARIGAGVLDPVGWAAGFGIGKGFQVAGIGSRALAQAGRPILAMASAGVEGAVGNVALTAGLDAMGEYVSAEEYGISALTGLGIGALLGSVTAFRRGPANADLGPDSITTFQGSPSGPFERHSWDYLGTGEGNHAQGKGHYTTANAGIGAWYWDALTRTADDALDNASAVEGSATSALLTRLRVNAANYVGLPPEVALGDARNIFMQAATMARDKVVEWLRNLATTFMDGISTGPSGRTALELDRLRYQADVATGLAEELDATIKAERGGSVLRTQIRGGDYLDWDTPLSQQSDTVQEAARGAGYAGPDDATGYEVYWRVAGHEGPIPARDDVAGQRAMAQGLDLDSTATRFRSKGILGNRYQSANTRAGRATDEFNYVSFSDDDIRIDAEWTPQTGWTNRPAPETVDGLIAAAEAARNAHMIGLREQVSQELGPDATPEQVTAGVREAFATDIRSALDYALADIPADQRLMVSEDILANSEAMQARLAEVSDPAQIADITERMMVEQATARAIRISDANPIDRAKLRTVLARVGAESTSTRLLLSESPVARAIGLTLLENPQGAGGRQRSAAITASVRERLYQQQLAGFDDEARLFRRRSGIGQIKDAFTGTGNNEFNRRVFLEIERRGGAGYIPDASPHIVKAANLFEQGMDIMRLEQQHVGTVGNARLGDTSRGYISHRADPGKVINLTPGQRARIRDVLSGQFQDIEGFDAEFADTLAAKYMERAIKRAHGRQEVPFNLHSPEAGDIVRDALEALDLGDKELSAIMGKFSRGGAGHTKKRLRLDLDADIGDGMKLVDIFVTDVNRLYRGYARRVAGEVALAQYGIMGKKGLDVLGVAMEATGATPAETRAFQQIASEFLNIPFGDWNHAWLDNTRLLTSASRLGGMGFTQLAEFGNAIPAVGVMGALRGVASLPRLLSEVRLMAGGGKSMNPILASLDRLGGQLGMDDFHQSRLFDVQDNSVQVYAGETMGVVTRAARSAAHTNMILSGHRHILAVQIRGMSEQIIRKAVKFARDGSNDIALRDMGFSDDLMARLRADLDHVATFDGNGELGALDLLKGQALRPQDVAEMVQAIERGSSQIIQRTYHGETGAWAHNGLVKLLAQFRTFSITSVEKQWGRNLNNHGAKSYGYLIGSMSFALPIHFARVQLKTLGMSEAKREEYLERNLNPLALGRATMNYASSAGLLGDIVDVVASVATTYGGELGEKFGEGIGVRGGSRNGFIPGVIAPGVGLLNDIHSGVIGGDLERLVKTMPGSGLPYLTPLVNAAFQD